MATSLFLALLIAWMYLFDSPAEASEKGLRGLQQLPSSLLEVYILEVSIQKGTVKPFDKDGCLSTNNNSGQSSKTNFYAVVKYTIHNSGDDFSPASAYKGEAGCHKPAIFNFLYLEGLIPSVKLSKYATCVVDDDLAEEDTCASSSSNGMTIRSGKSYGSAKKAVSVKFTIEDGDFATLFNAATTTQLNLNLKLSVNSLISPSVPGEVSVVKGSELGSTDWYNPTVFPAPVVLFSALSPTPTPTVVTTSMTTNTISPTAASTVVINNVLYRTDGYYFEWGRVLNLEEVQLFKNDIQIPTNLLAFSLSSNFPNTPASKCNDGLINNDYCHTFNNDPNPTLTIVSPMPFDKVVVYNRIDCCQNRIRDAIITATVNGQSQATTFPSAELVYTFLFSSSGLQLFSSAPTLTPTFEPTTTNTLSPTAAFNVVINSLVYRTDGYYFEWGRYLNIEEVQLFENDIQIPTNLLAFSLSSNYPSTPASNCNDGIIYNNNYCCTLGEDPNPTLTIVSAVPFDKVVVYNRIDCCQNRIQDAIITATVNGQSQATTFPSAELVYTFLFSSSGLQLFSSAPTLAPTFEPTTTNTLSPTAAFNVVITARDTSVCNGGKYITLSEVELFFNNAQLPSDSLTFSFSSQLPNEGEVSWSVTNCNDGILTNGCHSGHADALSNSGPTLTITSTSAFDKVVVYNLYSQNCWERINGATITSTIGGSQSSALFPLAAVAQYTFSLSSGSLIYSPCKK